jgi:hypothetical protein
MLCGLSQSCAEYVLSSQSRHADRPLNVRTRAPVAIALSRRVCHKNPNMTRNDQQPNEPEAGRRADERANPEVPRADETKAALEETPKDVRSVPPSSDTAESRSGARQDVESPGAPNLRARRTWLKTSAWFVTTAIAAWGAYTGTAAWRADQRTDVQLRTETTYIATQSGRPIPFALINNSRHAIQITGGAVIFNIRDSAALTK